MRWEDMFEFKKYKCPSNELEYTALVAKKGYRKDCIKLAFNLTDEDMEVPLDRCDKAVGESYQVVRTK